MIIDLEGRPGEPLQRAPDLRQLIDLCAPAGNDLDRFTFDERRLALRALSFKAFAAGDDQSRWRYEAGAVADA